MSDEIPHYDELTLRIDPAGDDAYHVFASAPRGGRATGRFRRPLSRDELDEFISNLTRSVRAYHSPHMENAKQIGITLFEQLMDGEIGHVYYAAHSVAETNGRGLRISLSMTEAPELSEIPWELLYDPGRRRFLSQSIFSPIVRSLDYSSPPAAAPVTFPMQVLALVSSPRGLPPLDVPVERAKLEKALCPLVRASRVRLEWLESATFSELTNRIGDRDELHVIHYIGHGAYDERTESGIVALEDDRGALHEVTGEELGACMCDKRSLRLVVLNACEGSRSSHVDPFSGVAQSLLGCGLPAVVGMQAEITDKAAITFSDRLYSTLAQGFPIDAALAQARRAIFSSGRNAEFGTPVLFMNVEDGRIFELSDTPPPPPIDPLELDLRPAPDTVPPGGTVTWHLKIRNADCAALSEVTVRDRSGQTRAGPLELPVGAETAEVWTETVDGRGVDESVTVVARNSNDEAVDTQARARVEVARRQAWPPEWWPPSRRALGASAAALVVLVLVLLVVGQCGSDQADFRVFPVGNDVPDLDARGDKLAFLSPVGARGATAIRRLDLDSGHSEEVALVAYKHNGLDMGLTRARRAQLVYSACDGPGDCRLYRKPFQGQPKPLAVSGTGCNDTRPSMWAGFVLFARGGPSCAHQLVLARANSTAQIPVAGQTLGADLNDGRAVWLSADGALVAKSVSLDSPVPRGQGTLRPDAVDQFTAPIVVEDDYVYFVHAQGSQTFIARARLPLEGSEIEHYVPRKGAAGAEDAPHFAVTGDTLFTTNYPQPDGKSGSRKITRVSNPKFDPAG